MSQDKEDFPKPNRIKKDILKRDKTKYCVFHHDVGHKTSKCFNLKEAIKAFIQRGSLQKFRDDLEEHAEQKSEAYGDMSLIVGGPHVRGNTRNV